MNKTTIVAVVGVALMLGGVLAACGSQSTPDAAPSPGSASAVVSTASSSATTTVVAPPPPVSVTQQAAPPPIVTVTQQPTGNSSGNYCDTLGNPSNCDPTVFTEPQGLLCSDLQARGWGYYDALYYWDRWGKPSNMDIDNNGIPCQTVYPQAPGYVGTSAPDPGTLYGDATDAPSPGDPLYARVSSLPAGLLCQDLRDRGYGYWDAFDYWIYWGKPDRMDADLNGVPCETVWTQAERNSYGN